ncbi:PQQ-binding-like beta-propeller repeat protein [Rhodobacteraceae bacterium NNCM2]|nr:PQQ-binding-like beta-propeller repeat protein [Coraliihabitans acroporae]
MVVKLRASRALVLVLGAALTLSGCGWFDDEEIMEGERIKLRTNDTRDSTVNVIPRPIAAASTNSQWTQTNGRSTHNSGNLQGPIAPNIAWRADAGQGNSDESWITSPPIAVNGKVITLDADASVRAFDGQSGSVIWEADVALEGEDGDEGFGGGMAADGPTIFVTTGFGEVLALSESSGEILWRVRFDAPFRSAPSTANGIVIVVGRDNQAYALRGSSGELVWRNQGVAAEASFLGGATAAISGGLVILPYSSGELVALDIGTGRPIWSAIVTGGRRGLARSSITDITGDPVVAGPFVLGANQSGRLIAIDGRSGSRVWTRGIGSTKPLWPVEDTMFLMSDLAELTRIDLRDGSTLWQTPLPAFEDAEDREDQINYSGPVVVSGKVIVTDSLGNLWSFDAVTGEGDVILELPEGSRTGPIVANGTVYVLTDDADLLALR